MAIARRLTVLASELEGYACAMQLSGEEGDLAASVQRTSPRRTVKNRHHDLHLQLPLAPVGVHEHRDDDRLGDGSGQDPCSERSVQLL